MIKSKNLELILIKTPEYLQEKSCIGCSYFRQVKGHFGQCVGALDKKNNPSNKYYDGTRKGSACSLYRTSMVLPENVEVKTLEQYREERLKFNVEEKAKRKRIRAIKSKGNPFYARHGLNESKENIKGFKQPNFTKYYKDMPFQLTSDVGSVKKGYFGHQYNHHVINYALKLFKENLNAVEIQRKIKEYYNVKPSTTVLSQWRIKFLKIKKINPNININCKEFGLFWNMTNAKLNLINKQSEVNNKTISCPRCSKVNNIIKHGKRHNYGSSVQRYDCGNCGYLFSVRGMYKGAKINPVIIEKLPILFKLGLSTHDISKTLLRENGIEISHGSVSKWLKRLVPEIQFKVNGSHKPEIRKNISNGVKRYCNSHNLKGRGLGVSKKLKWMLDLQKKYEGVDDISIAKRILQQEINRIKPQVILCQ